MVKEVFAKVCDLSPSVQQETSQSGQPKAQAEFTDIPEIRSNMTANPITKVVRFMTLPHFPVSPAIILKSQVEPIFPETDQSKTHKPDPPHAIAG
jgi:hypothetical protein